MNANKELVIRFYSAFQKLDYKGMAACYSSDVQFYDPVFGLLEGDHVGYMWEMLCKNAVSFSLTYGNINALDEEYCTCDWVARYDYSATGRKVVNCIMANMRCSGGRIAEHSDAFSLHQWSRQAFGFTGYLLGWSSFFQNRVKNQARKNLLKFIQSKKSAG